MACGDVLSLEDLQTAKKHQIFEAEVITGKVGGVAGGANIDYATNAATGQTQKTLPAILRDLGFEPASFDFTTGGPLGVNDRNKAVLWPLASGGDGGWYNWEGVLPKVVPAASTPYTTGGVADGAWRPVGDITLRGYLNSPYGADLVGSATYAQIRAYDGDGDRIDCLGRANAFDGGAGSFRLKDTPAVKVDDGGTYLIDALGRGWAREYDGVALFSWWEGADPTGVINGTDAMHNAGLFMRDNGGTIRFQPGLYVVGRQTFAGQTGLGYSYLADTLFYVEGSTHDITVDLGDATIRLAPGQRYGSFDPVTGAPIVTTTPYFNLDSTAGLGYMFRFVNHQGRIRIIGGNLDGNMSNMIIGGKYGDEDWQLVAYGINVLGHHGVHIEGTFSYNHCTDAMYIGQYPYGGWVDDNTIRPVLLENVKCHGSGRNNLSYTGGNKFTAINSAFNYSGSGAVTGLNAGIDFEAETGPIKNCTLINCDFLGNRQFGIQTFGDARDVVSIKCRFDGPVGSYAALVYPASGVVFDKCTIFGNSIRSETVGFCRDDDAIPLVKNCRLVNRRITGTAANGRLLQAVNKDIRIENCFFDIIDPVGGTSYLDVVSANSSLLNSTIAFRGTSAGSGTLGVFAFGRAKDLVFQDKLISAGANLTFDVGAASLDGLHVDSGIVKVAGVVGISTRRNSIIYNQLNNGTWTRGEQIYHVGVSAGSSPGYICTTSGTNSAVSTTGNISAGSNVLTNVANIAAFGEGIYISIAGAVTKARVQAIDGANVYLSANATATVSGAAVTNVPAVLKAMPSIAA